MLIKLTHVISRNQIPCSQAARPGSQGHWWQVGTLNTSWGLWHQVTRSQCLSGHKVSASQLALDPFSRVSSHRIDSWHSPYISNWQLTHVCTLWSCFLVLLFDVVGVPDSGGDHCTAPSTRVCVISSCPRSEAPGQHHRRIQSLFLSNIKKHWSETVTCLVKQPALHCTGTLISKFLWPLTNNSHHTISLQSSLEVWLYLWFQSNAVAAVYFLSFYLWIIFECVVPRVLGNSIGDPGWDLLSVKTASF